MDTTDGTTANTVSAGAKVVVSMVLELLLLSKTTLAHHSALQLHSLKVMLCILLDLT